MTDSDPRSTQSPSANGETNGDKPANGLVNKLLRRLGLISDATLRDHLTGALSEEETLADEAFSPEERAMLRNVLGLRERRVADAMVPRADIIAIDHQVSLGKLLECFREAGHSRVPVYRETLDDPIGMVHIKDVMNMITKAAICKPDEANGGKEAWSLDLQKVDLEARLNTISLIRRVLFVPPSMKALDLLAQMQATRVHMGVIVDEYGGTDGLVTIEDLMEEIVGEIEDEHDADETPTITKDAAGGFIVDARILLEELSSVLEVDLTVDEAAEEVDTLGGFVFTLLGRVPVRGEIISHGDFLEFEVVDADPRRIKRMRIVKRDKPVDETDMATGHNRRASEQGHSDNDDVTNDDDSAGLNNDSEQTSSAVVDFPTGEPVSNPQNAEEKPSGDRGNQMAG